jgi:hypothetical protein
MSVILSFFSGLGIIDLNLDKMTRITDLNLEKKTRIANINQEKRQE